VSNEGEREDLSDSKEKEEKKTRKLIDYNNVL
jgi:hypothetical protein